MDGSGDEATLILTYTDLWWRERERERERVVGVITYKMISASTIECLGKHMKCHKVGRITSQREPQDTRKLVLVHNIGI